MTVSREREKVRMEEDPERCRTPGFEDGSTGIDPGGGRMSSCWNR